MKHMKDKSSLMKSILLTIFIVIIGIIIGISQVYKINGYGKRYIIEGFEDSIECTANSLKDKVERYHDNLSVTAHLLGQDGVLSREYIVELTSAFMSNYPIKEIYVVNRDGFGYNSNGEQVDVSSSDIFRIAMIEEDEVTEIITIINNESVVYRYPIKYNSEAIGILFATVSTDIRTLSNDSHGYDRDNDLIYILNKNKEIIFTNHLDEWNSFDYEKISNSDNFYYDYFDNINELSYKNGSISPKNNEGNYIWLQKPLGVNEWSILVGKHNIVNKFSYNIVQVIDTGLMVVAIILFALLLLFVTSLRKSKEKLIGAMHMDPITGGDNWYKFRKDTDRIIHSRKFNNKNYALVNFDINRFRVINDSFGYQKGDEILKGICVMLKLWIEPGELYTRYAADQFYLLLNYRTKEDLEERLHDLNYYLHQSEHLQYTKFYFGTFLINEVKDSVDRMGDFATVAKQKIKGSNDIIISFFDEESKQKLLKEEQIEKRMHLALKNEEFLLYLQPKISLDGEKVAGAEALVRWKNEDGEMISPGYFIPIFEKNGFIIQLDLYMLRKICELLREWKDTNQSCIPISVNMSRIHFTNLDFANIIEDIVDEYEIPHELIEVELTESAFLQNKKMLIDTVDQLRSKGFMVSMDDFGAGYSSLNLLKDIPLDTVKLDGELFRITNELERGLIVIRNTIAMAKELDMKVVAECIETKEQVDFLTQVGCDIIQGYYYAKPMPSHAFEKRYVLSKV